VWWRFLPRMQDIIQYRIIYIVVHSSMPYRYIVNGRWTNKEGDFTEGH